MTQLEADELKLHIVIALPRPLSSVAMRVLLLI